MSSRGGAILVERLDAKRFRATCTLFPDCEVIAASEEAARQAIEPIVERLLRERQESSPQSPTGTRSNESD